MRAMRKSGLVAAIAAMLALATSAQASGDFPSKPVRLLTSSAGSGGDLNARNLGPQLSERWGQPVVIENRPQPVIHAELVAKAPPNGHTLLMGQISSHASPPSLYKKLAYDPVKDFSAITLVSKAPLLLVAHPSIPASNAQEFIAYARQRPGAIRYAAQSGSSSGRLTMALFTRRAGLEVLYVPYKSPAMSLNALLAQEAHVSFLSVAASWPQVKAGKLRAYAITSEKRFSGTSEIPTMAESGMSGFESTLWFAVFAPAGMPPALVMRLNRDMVEILQTPAFQSAMHAQGAQVESSTPEQLSAFVKSEIQKWGEIIKAIGIKPE